MNNKLNETLFTAASTLDIILGEDFHDEYTQENPPSTEQFKSIKDNLEEYAHIAGVDYVYSMVMVENSVYFVVSNETDEDRQRGLPSLFFNLYSQPPEELFHTFENNVISYTMKHENAWGSFYSVFIPRLTAEGQTYILAADITSEYGQSIMRIAFIRSLITIILFLIPLIPGHYLLNYFAKKREKELLYQLYTDKLTGLPNRTKFIIDCQENYPVDISAIMFDIDSFKEINNLFGGIVGDQVLQHVSEIISYFCSNEETLYKFPADEYVVLTMKQSIDDIKEMISGILKTIVSSDFYSKGQPLSLNVSAGLTYKPENQRKMLSSLNMAKNLAKQDSQGLAVYDKTLNLEKQYETNHIWLNKLKDALREDRIVPYYQPIYNNKTGKIEKYEALVRLIDTDGIVYTPNYFLEVAKRSKLYNQITRTMIRKTIEDFKYETFSVSLNFTTRDLMNDQTIQYLLSQVELHKMYDRVVIELVESESIIQYKQAIELTRFFNDNGIKVAIDDFGSGYSNFEYLTKIHADFLKIDGSLINDILNDNTSASLVSAIVAFAEDLKIPIIAEYVSSEEILNHLKKIGVEYSQGFFIGKPAPFSNLKRIF
jgi:diguanylate cyclase (GGDEF)-like protein